MIEATGGARKVAGKRREIAATGPSPGRTPTRVPIRTPRKQKRRFKGWRATSKPKRMWLRMSMEIEAVHPRVVL
jgi:hypothetical protein